MNMLQTASTSCHSLVALTERELGRSLAPSVREAFVQTPRHLFVQHYYEHQHLKTAPSSSDETAWDEWLAAIYRNQALTTQIDARGLPISSSSQPSVMAVMLEQLDIRPGMRLLEIGTGTGYNAALLAILAGSPHLVTTLDIDPTLIDLARPRIEQVVGTGMSVRLHNGIDGYEPDAPYDRILATGSILPVPLPWIKQLKPEGRLVMDLRSSPDMLAAPSLPRGYQQFPLQEVVCLSPNDPGYDCAAHFSTYEQFRGQDDEVNLWLQWIFPGLGIKWKGSLEALSAVLTDASTRTVVTIEKHEQEREITVRGERPLWSEILHAYQDWLKVGKPGRENYTLLLDRQGRQVMSMESHGLSRSFLLAERPTDLV
jgi:protein-L-isoaspartate(D-aspartate) O-methyltransferase